MEITLTQLSEETGYSVPNLCQMIRRGHLPAGRKDGKVRFLPAAECRAILLASGHKPKSPWRLYGTRMPNTPVNHFEVAKQLAPGVEQISKAWRDAI